MNTTKIANPDKKSKTKFAAIGGTTPSPARERVRTVPKLMRAERVEAHRLLEMVLDDGTERDAQAIIWNLEIAASSVALRPKPKLAVVSSKKAGER